MQSRDWCFLYRDSCVVRTYSLLFLSLCECYSSFPFHFVFFHIWDLGYNSSKFILAMLCLLFQVFTKVSSKFNTEFISYNALCWWSVHVPPFHQTIINRLWSNGYLAPLLKSFAFKFWLFLLCILTPSPNGDMFCFNQFYKQCIVSFVYIYLELSYI